MRPYALVSGEATWRSGRHDATRYDPELDAVTLSPVDPAGGCGADDRPPFAAPRAIAATCSGEVLRAATYVDETAIEGAARELNGHWVTTRRGVLEGVVKATAMVLGPDDRLWVVESDSHRLIAFDVPSFTGSRTLDEPGIVDVASSGTDIVALVARPPQLLFIDECGRAVRRRVRRRGCVIPRCARPRRLAVNGSDIVVLWRDPQGNGWLSDGDGNALVAGLRWPTDVEFDTDFGIVVAHAIGMPFSTYRRGRSASWIDGPSLRADGYDGTGLVRRTGSVWYWSMTPGVQHPAAPIAAARRYAAAGHVTTSPNRPLDAGAYGVTWGRMFVDACVPPGTFIDVRCATADDLDDGDEPDHAPQTGGAALDELAVSGWQPMHRRSTGTEQPWVVAADGLSTWEAPVLAPPGRFLWLSIRLRSDGVRTPEVRTVRVERPSHELLRHLPKIYSRDVTAADFLRRLLAPTEGLFLEFDDSAATRDRLLDPDVAPSEALPWLAGFVGLVLDERWSESARRRLIASAAQLFARRGTVRGLEEFAGLALDRQVDILEEFRLRGMAVSGSSALVGSGMRIGDRLGPAGGENHNPKASPFDVGAHRFVVIVRSALSGDEDEVLRRVLDLHRPAHTSYRICVLAGMARVGQDLLGVTTLIGDKAGFEPVRLGTSKVGAIATLGRGQRPRAEDAA